MNREEFEKTPEIERIRIPSTDAAHWIKTLLETGFSTEEVDYIMKSACDEYALQKVGQIVRDISAKLQKDFEKEFKRELSPAARASLQEYVLDQIRNARPEILEKLRQEARQQN